MATPGLVSNSSIVAVGALETPATPTARPLPGTSLAKPKSRILAWPRWVTKIFAGLMSRCTIPLECAASKASEIWMASSSSVSILSGLFSMRVRSVCPSSNSMANEGLSVELVDVMNGADIGVIERGSGLRFAPEALQGLMIFGRPFRQELKRHGATQLGVFRLKDHTHTAPAALFHDPIVRDGLADHGRRL